MELELAALASSGAHGEAHPDIIPSGTLAVFLLPEIMAASLP
jgi:hypothetical protein